MPVKMCYIDGSMSTVSIRGRFDLLAHRYAINDWRLYEFSTYVKEYAPGQFDGRGSCWDSLKDHFLHNSSTLQVTDAVFITDDASAIPTSIRCWLADHDIEIIAIQEKADWQRTLLSPRPTQTKNYTNAFRKALHEYEADRFGPISHTTMFGPTNHTTMHTVPFRPQEAHMNTHPTITTSVSLANGHSNVTIADLKRLITEVERVGGDDSSVVTFNNNSYRWDVALSVKANEVEPEMTLSEAEVAALVAEATTATRARKAEIRQTLGL